jgi:hypothetical protein
MKKILIFATACTFGLNLNGQNQKGQSILGEATGDNSGISVSMPTPNTVAIGAEGNDGNGNNSGHARVYSWNGINWVQKGQDLDGVAATDFFGASLSMPDENTIGIGARGNDNAGLGRGHAGVFTWDAINNLWVQKGNYIDGEANLDNSGRTVFMPDENTIAIGAPDNDGNGSNAGHVRIFVWNGVNWVQKGTDIDGTAASDFSGNSISMPDANTIAIGAVANDINGSNSGEARIFRWNGTNWVQKGLSLYGDAIDDNFGQSVSMSDSNTIAVGSDKNDDAGTSAGKVKIFSWNGNSWVQKGSDIVGDSVGTLFGASISMFNPDVISIGAIGNPTVNPGRVRVFYWDGTSWLQAENNIDGDFAGDGFGRSVSMGSNNTVAIGANFNNLNTGHVKVYQICIPVSSSQNLTACDSISWIDGNTYTASGTYSYQTISTLGCDSTVVLNLIINNNTFSAQNEISQDSFLWSINGQTYTQSGSYTAIIPNTEGCDSIITLNLTLSFTSTYEFNNSEITISPNPAYEFISLNVDPSLIGKEFIITDIMGRVSLQGKIDSENTQVSVISIPSGVYFFSISDTVGKAIKIVKQ